MESSFVKLHVIAINFLKTAEKKHHEQQGAEKQIVKIVD